MKNKDPLFFIAHILESIELIESYIDKKSEKKFKDSPQIQDSCIRRLEIIGEAVKNLPVAIKEMNDEIPWKKMAGMRDVLIHEYFGVDIELTWNVLSNELPKLKKKILKLRKELEKEKRAK